MEAQDFVRTPEGQITGGTVAVGGTTSIIDSWQYDAAINSFPGLTWRVHNSKAGPVQSVTAADNIKEMAVLQANMFASVATEISASLTDGTKAGTFSFKGIELAPRYSTGIGSTGVTHTAMHKAAELSSYRPFIYSGNTAEFLREKPLSDTNICKRVWRILQAMILDWEFGGRNPEGLDVAEMADIHTRNKSLLNLVDQVLNNSNTVIKELGELDDRSQRNINAWIVSQLRNPSADFFSTMSGIAAEFRLFYLPPISPNDLAGKFATAEATFAAPAFPATLEVTSQIDLSPGVRALLPLSKVAVVGLREDFFREISSPNRESGETAASRLVGFPPQPLGSGRLEAISPPAYLPTDILHKDNPAQTGSEAPELQNTTPTLSNTQSDAVVSICKRHAKLAWYDRTLALSTASVSIALSFGENWQPGFRYEISVAGEEGSEQIFKGLLVKVTHSLNISGNNASAGTILNFTHVEIGNFSLSELLGEDA